MDATITSEAVTDRAPASSMVDRLTAVLGYSLFLDRFAHRLDARAQREIVRQIAADARELARLVCGRQESVLPSR